jgi:hypothetical protein
MPDDAPPEVESHVSSAVEPQREPPRTTISAGEPTHRRRPVDPRPPDYGVTCEIVFWRGYRKARFYACVFDQAGERLALAESPEFRSPGKDFPDQTESTVAAHDRLTEQLLAEGWELLRKGPGWYQAKFRR